MLARLIPAGHSVAPHARCFSASPAALGLKDTPISVIMGKECHTIDVNASVAKATLKMNEKKIGSLAITQDGMVRGGGCSLCTVWVWVWNCVELCVCVCWNVGVRAAASPSVSPCACRRHPLRCAMSPRVSGCVLVCCSPLLCRLPTPWHSLPHSRRQLRTHYIPAGRGVWGEGDSDSTRTTLAVCTLLLLRSACV